MARNRGVNLLSLNAFPVIGKGRKSMSPKWYYNGLNLVVARIMVNVLEIRTILPEYESQLNRRVH